MIKKHTQSITQKNGHKLRLFVAGILAMFAIFSLAEANGQQNYNNKTNSTMQRPTPVVEKPGVDSSFTTNKKEAAIEEELVQLALKGPVYDETDHQAKISRQELSKARDSWLDLLTISANYNDQTFAKTTEQSAYVYPKYFFGVTIPLGLVFSQNHAIKIAKQNIAISADRQEEASRAIRADVLSKYKQYQTYVALLNIQNQTVEDSHIEFMQIENQFKNGSSSLELYNAASKNYNIEVAKKLNLQLERDMMKLEIEKVIGVDLDNVLNK
ncbi:MAG TPA: TolC family protein [Flavipsychrobacter sp.]|nr:TolC family protein [Flavipsychrobacter sp.]